MVLGKGYDGGNYFLPPVAGAAGEASNRLFAEGLPLYGADEAFARQHLQRDDLEVTEDRDNFDYLYLRSDLAELPGNRYHKKKEPHQLLCRQASVLSGALWGSAPARGFGAPRRMASCPFTDRERIIHA
ncbi:phosphatidylglycerol lysyltransferase domain-containing protein [Geotalea toluenoxydans]|uniref:phosphatidylglycerol lysyltransferase domain-containing protein n=1 Tax=Geotalea toluenoxydans TaxID=421624 RepID=UPI0034E30181